MNDYVNIGRLVATFGVKGELVLKHALGKKTQLKDIEALFIEETKGSYLPYFLVAAQAKNNEEVYILLEGIDTKEAAHRLTQKNVWLQQDDFQKVVSKTSPLSLLGFQVVNEGEPIGRIEEVIEQPHQVLLRITINNNEALIPLHDETLDKIDRTLREVHVTLPEGLLDIYQ